MAPGAPDDSPEGVERRRELRRRIQALRMARLTQVLDLDDTTAAKLFPAINRLDEKGAQIAEERGKLLRKLEGIARKGGDDPELASTLDAFFAAQKTQRDMEEETHKKLREILTPKQVAQFLLFHERFGDEVREMLHGSAPRDGGAGRGDDDRRRAEMKAAHESMRVQAKKQLEQLHQRAMKLKEEAGRLRESGHDAEAREVERELEAVVDKAHRIEAEVQKPLPGEGGGGEPGMAPTPKPAKSLR
jgi:hypothetical protein